MWCCGSMTNESIKITALKRSRSMSTVPIKRVADPGPLTLTDDVLFRWARIMRIAQMFPVMHSIRALENKIQTTICRSCRDRHKRPEIDRSSLDQVRRLLAECSDEKARLVKEAAGIVQYRVHYHDLSGCVREIVR